MKKGIPMSIGKKGSLARRVAAAVGALAVGVMGLAGAALTANADTGKGNIIVPPDSNSVTTLTIHKHDDSKVGAAGDGNEITDSSKLGPGLAGVTFKITQITAKDGQDINLDTPEGWDIVNPVVDAEGNRTPITADQVLDASNHFVKSDAPTEATTKDGGATDPQTLPHGLYLVEETGYGNNNITTPAAPFLVTLPLPQGNGGWLYNVHVYPKNKVNTNVPTKDVADPTNGLNIRSIVPWTIKAPVQPDKPGDITKFTVTDQLDSRLKFSSLTVDVFTEGTDYVFTEGTDYTVDPANAGAADGELIKVNFTAAGLKKLKAGDVVTLKLNTTVESLGDNGVIPNQATVFTNDNGDKITSKPGVPGTNPTTNWGPLGVLKYAQGDKTKTLAGAVFAIYASEADANAGTNEVTTITTGSDGKALAKLYVGKDDVTSKGYWIKEITAPAGYVLDSKVTSVTVKAGSDASVVNYEIANTQQDHPDLPLTGAAGTVVMTLGGLALVAAGGAAYAVSRKRSAR
jgi:fimbrial isopeptide formation D2 family protein/LPXTG-motif cell wall-anchored protein